MLYRGPRARQRVDALRRQRQYEAAADRHDTHIRHVVLIQKHVRRFAVRSYFVALRHPICLCSSRYNDQVKLKLGEFRRDSEAKSEVPLLQLQPALTPSTSTAAADHTEAGTDFAAQVAVTRPLSATSDTAAATPPFSASTATPQPLLSSLEALKELRQQSVSPRSSAQLRQYSLYQAQVQQRVTRDVHQRRLRERDSLFHDMHRSYVLVHQVMFVDYRH
jgi:hypothetical protein